MPKRQSEENSDELILNEETFGKRNSQLSCKKKLINQTAVRASLTASTKAKVDGVHLGGSRRTSLPAIFVILLCRTLLCVRYIDESQS